MDGVVSADAGQAISWSESPQKSGRGGRQRWTAQTSSSFPSGFPSRPRGISKRPTGSCRRMGCLILNVLCAPFCRERGAAWNHWGQFPFQTHNTSEPWRMVFSERRRHATNLKKWWSLEEDARGNPDSGSLGLADVLEGGSACGLKEPIPKSGRPGSATGPLAGLGTGSRVDLLGESVQDSLRRYQDPRRLRQRGPAACVLNSDPVWRKGAMTGPETPIFSQPGRGSHVNPAFGLYSSLGLADYGEMGWGGIF